MRVGDSIVLTEHVVVMDSLGQEYLLPGTEGKVVNLDGLLISMRNSKDTYHGIPLRSVKIKKAEKIGGKAA